MKINYAGKVELSTIDWHGHAAYVLFLNGCPLQCPRCHNFQLRKAENWVRIAEPLADICKALPFINHLVVSGGEPLAQPEACREIIEFAHLKGMKVAVETSGCFPLVDGFDKTFLSLQCSLQRGVYDPYVRKLGAFDSFMSNLARMDPERSEIRMVLFPDPSIDWTTLSAIRGFPVRITIGRGMGDGIVDQKHLMEFAFNVYDFLGYSCMEISKGMVVMR